MKIQHLAIVFIIIMLPISMVITYYIQTQIDTINLQGTYNSKLQTATYDAIKSFQLNTINNKYSTISDSKIRDIEASISTFYNSLGTELGATGYNEESLRQFIPAILYTMYDGYYIYGEYYNETNDSYQYGLKPYIYYSCRYKKGNSDFIVNYTLDNTITIYGIVSGQYITKSGSLISPSMISEIQKNANGEVISLKYDGVLIQPEILKEQLITIDQNNFSTNNEYEYLTYSNKKIYKDDKGYFWNNKNNKQYITDNETLNFVQKNTIGGHLYSNSAVKYYADAYEFSIWVNSNLSTITQSNAIDSNGNKIQDFAISTQENNIFKLSEANNPLVSDSNFNQNRISVIRKSIESNLSSAIANFGSSAEYEFVMPSFTEDDWDKLVNNVSVSTFMQGVPIGAKFYNNYCIISNDKNKEVVTEDSIYVVTEDGQVHYPGCKDIIDNDKTIVQAYKNIDFERQTVVITEGDERYFYPQHSEKCYDCMVNIAETYDIDEIIKGKVTIYNTNEKDFQTKDIRNTTLRKIYLTSLAREKYDLYRTNNYFGN
ncbi:MAG: hypothetical protein GX682_04725 [Clostridiaceae bacterium]|nr:hypothetical protein [Clostridiaceae bacterium]